MTARITEALMRAMPNTLPEAMRRALTEAADAAKRGEVPIGAVLAAADGRIVAAAGNRTLELDDPTAHAEMLVIRAACAEMGSERLPGCHIYVSLEPCAMCAAAISFARLSRLYFAAPDVKMGAVENGVRFFNQDSCHHRPEVYGGIGETEAAAMLRTFFAVRRERR